MPYIFDTNSFRVLGNYYPDRFPSFWEQFNEAVRTDSVFSVREVRRELEVQATSQWLSDWVKANSGIFRAPTAEETAFLPNIFQIEHFRALVGEKQRLKGSPVADPFLVACAKVHGGCVVTEEQLKPNAAKIPNVCHHFGVDYCDVEGFLERVGWAF